METKEACLDNLQSTTVSIVVELIILNFQFHLINEINL